MYTHQNKTIYFKQLGLVAYEHALRIQTDVFDKLVAKKLQNRDGLEIDFQQVENYLLFCEHPHVYTLGRSGAKDNLLVNEEELSKQQAVYVETNRGGDITYHGPGQLVGYPIFDLDNFFTDIHKYLRYLEEAVILTLKEYGLESGRIEGLTGVWLDIGNPAKARKICAMGVKASRWVTMHGFALNVNTDLSYFNNIIPCGISDKAVTSMKSELGHQVDMKQVEEKLKVHLAELFQAEIIPAQDLAS